MFKCAGTELNRHSQKAGGLQPLGLANAQPTQIDRESSRHADRFYFKYAQRLELLQPSSGKQGYGAQLAQASSPKAESDSWSSSQECHASAGESFSPSDVKYAWAAASWNPSPAP